MLSLGIALDNGATPPDNYETIYRELCTNILANTDERLIAELEGLDLYLDVFVHNGTAVQTPATNENFATGEQISIVYAFKKKSAAACS